MRKRLIKSIFIEYEKRQTITKEQSFKYKLISLLVAFIIMGIIFAAFQINPFYAIISIFSWALLEPLR